MRVMFGRTNSEHSPLSFTEHCAKFQVPVPDPVPTPLLLLFVHNSPNAMREVSAL